MDNERSATLPSNGLSRSKSFAGILAPRRPATASTLGRESTPTNKRSSWFGSGMVSSSPVSGSTLSLNSKSRASVVRPAANREPRPDRTRVVLAAVVGGLHDAIAVTEEDIANLKASLQGLSTQSQQQLKAAERYLKRLDCQLSAVEELQEAYGVQCRLREGVRAMGKAYIESLGPERDAALANVRTGFKECNEVLCALEAQLESLIGAFHVQMKGLQGFARLCPGDVFEITLRHGHQKWRTRGKIGRDGSQTWDSQKFLFKSLMEEVLYIRASEVRSLGKQVVLGNKYCDTLELFCAQSQMMTVNLNTSGTLKLNLIVTWDPLYGVADENGGPLKQQQQLTSSPSHRPRSLAASSSQSPTGTMSSSMAAGSVTALSVGSLESEGTTSPDHDSGKNSTLDSTSPMNDFHELISTLREEDELKEDESSASSSFPSPDYSTDGEDHDHSQHARHAEENHYENVGSPLQKNLVRTTADVHSNNQAGGIRQANMDLSGNFLLVRRAENNDNRQQSNAWWQQTTTDSGYGGSVPDSRKHVSRVHLYPETEEPEGEPETGSSGDWRRAEESTNLEAVIRNLNGHIADIQGQYPELEVFERNISNLFQLSQKYLRDDGSSTSLSSLAVENALECFNFLEEEEDVDASDAKSCRDASRPVTPCPLQKKAIFNQQIDAALLIHLLYSSSLIQNLGSFGPLRIKERHSLDKLQTQGRVLGKLVNLLDRFANSKDCEVSGLDELHGLPHLQKLWSMTSPGGHALVVASEDIVSRLMPLCRATLAHLSNEMQLKVMRQFVGHCQDAETYDPSWGMTVFQFRYFVRSKERSFQARLEEIADQICLLDAFSSEQTNGIQRTITRLSLIGPLPNKAVLWRMGRLLVDHSDHSTNPRLLVASYLKNCAKDTQLRLKLIDSYVEGLESADAKDRQGSCEALNILQARDAVEQLAFIAQTDSSKHVQESARTALKALGGEGREALEQLQLSSHGFQGLSVRQK